MRQTIALSYAVLALISNVSAVSLNQEITAFDNNNGFMRTIQKKEFGTEKRESDENDNPILHDRAKELKAIDAAAKIAHEEAAKKQQEAAKKAHEEAEFRRKFNPFDGLIHEDDGSSWNKGDGVSVRGVNKFSQKSHKMDYSTIQTEGIEVADRNFSEHQMEEDNKIFAQHEQLRQEKALAMRQKQIQEGIRAQK